MTLVNAPLEIEMLFELANMSMADPVGFKKSPAGAAVRSSAPGSFLYRGLEAMRVNR